MEKDNQEMKYEFDLVKQQMGDEVGKLQAQVLRSTKLMTDQAKNFCQI